MRPIRDSHAQWRELIATRLDRPLTRSESRYLNSHLKGCEACRQVEHDYRAQRKLLRALPPRIPPRDMWARTSAALDREVARGAYRGRIGSTGRRGSPSAALLTTLATVGVVAALAVMQVMPATQIAPPSAAAKATPFAVNPQSLAFLGNQEADTFLFQVDVAYACPQTELDCDITDAFVRNAVNLPSNLRARNATVDPTGRNLAFVGHGTGRDLIGVLVLPPGSDGPVPTATDGSGKPPEIPVATGEPANTTSPETQTPVTPLPGATASAPPPSAVPGLTVLAILENVHSAGAPPDWSPSGEMLAFSAMPADGSTGPDVYVWAPSDERARAITSDHNSYFASWSGERIVASRVAITDDGGAAARTVVIDPLTLEERRVTGLRMWLPVVDPSGTHVIAWRGEMSMVNGLAATLNGALYIVDWTQVDPFAPGNEAPPPPEATDSPAPEPTVEPAATAAPVAT
ncbi:MAG: zf-HC2 domain-containing protein, partial [Chloroflexota bacterium]